jgi:SOUL heme-binding protein
MKTNQQEAFLMTKKTAIALAGVAGVALYRAAKSSRVFAEKVAYAISQKDGPFEVREYPALTVASAPLSEGENSAFQRLHKFIKMGNAQRQKVAMTTPVFIDRKGGEGNMSFVLPEATKTRGVPQPDDEVVTLGERPSERVSVYRFSGRAQSDNEEQAIKTLRDWTRDHGLEDFGEPIIAYYNAPWTPSLLRHNEVMLRVKREI